MRSVKTSVWSVSGLREIHRFERALRHAAKQNILFSSSSKKTFSLFLHFQYFFINFPMLATSETLSADAGCVPCGRPSMQKPVAGGEKLLMRSGLTVGIDLWIRRLLSALFLTAWNFATSHVVKEHSSGRCPWVCNHQPEVYLIIYKVCQRCDIHTGVGFCVARSDYMGNARASGRGTSNCKTPTLEPKSCVYPTVSQE